MTQTNQEWEKEFFEQFAEDGHEHIVFTDLEEFADGVRIISPRLARLEDLKAFITRLLQQEREKAVKEFVFHLRRAREVDKNKVYVITLENVDNFTKQFLDSLAEQKEERWPQN